MDPEQFVADFPEFASTAQYPVSAIQFWINIATAFLNAERSGTALNYGIELFVAHNLVLSAQQAAAGAAGGAPGAGTGVTASKSIDKVSISYDVAAGTVAGGGNWNLTTYGTRYYQLAQMAGMGAVQSTGCGFVPSPEDIVGAFGIYS